MIPVAEPRTAEEALELYRKAHQRHVARWTPVIVAKEPEPVIEVEPEPEPEVVTEPAVQEPACIMPRRKNPSDRLIFEAVVAEFGFAESDIRGHSRQGHLVFPRHVAMWLFEALTNYSRPAIARRFCGRDHSTIFHAVKKIGALRVADDETRHVCDHLYLTILERFERGEA